MKLIEFLWKIKFGKKEYKMETIKSIGIHINYFLGGEANN